MGKIFKTRKDVKFFAVFAAVLLFGMFLISSAKSFEKEWYNIDYEDYIKNAEFYSVSEATIIEFDTVTHKDNSGITILDRYYTALVELTYAGGQTRTCRVPRNAADEIGEKISVAYDKRYDTEYEKAIDSEDVEEGHIPEIARTEEVKFTRYSTILIIAECILMFLTVLYMIWCSKKEKPKMFFE